MQQVSRPINPTIMPSEGSHEVKAARQRLAAAKAQKESAFSIQNDPVGRRNGCSGKENGNHGQLFKGNDCNRKNREEAQMLFQSTKKEVEEAEALLNESKKRGK